MYRLTLCVLAMVACVKTNTVQCPDGIVCPEGTVCAAMGCVMQGQLDACRDLDEGAACTAVGVADGACRGGVCVELTCGDGFKAPAEMCDPGVTGEAGESTCQARGFYDEDITVHCGDDCVWDTSGCSLYCGDNIVTSPYESCDGVAPAGTCLDYGFDRGVLGCRPGLCVAGFDSCGTIGWSVGSSGVLTNNDAQTLGNELYVAGAVPDASGGLAGVIRRYNGSWTSIGDFTTAGPSKPLPRAVFALAANDIWVAGTHNGSPDIGKGFVAHYDGTSWSMPVQLDPLGAFDIWAAASNDVHVLYTNEVRHWNGSSWTTTSLGTNSGASRLWGSGPDDVYLVGTAIGARHYTSGAWSTLTTPFTKAYRVWGASANAVFVLAADPNEANALEVFRWNGSQWQDLELPATGGLVPIDDQGLNVWGTAANEVYVARRVDQYSTGPIHIYHYDGTSWRLISDRFLPNGELVLGGSDASHVFAMTYANVYEYSGSSWQHQPPATTYIYRLWAASDANAFATDEPGKVYHFDGSSWTEVAGITGHMVGGSSGSNVYTYDYSLDRFYHYDGQSWSGPVSAGTTVNEREVLVRAQNDVYLLASGKLWSWNGSTLTDLQLGFIVGGATCGQVACLAFNSTTVRVSMAAGTWTTLPAVTGVISAAWIADDGTAFASMIGGAMLRYRNGAWETVASATSLAYGRIHGTSASDVFAFNDATATLAHFDGTSWTPVRTPSPAGSGLIDLFATAKTVFVAGAANGSAVLMHLDRLRPW